MMKTRKRKTLSLEGRSILGCVMKGSNIILNKLPCTHPIGQVEEALGEFYCKKCGVNVSGRKIFECEDDK